MVTALARRMFFGLRRDRRQHHRGGGDRHVEPVVFADGDDIEAGIVGEFCRGEDFGKPLLGAGGPAGLCGREVAETIEPEFKHAASEPSLLSHATNGANATAPRAQP